MLRDLEVALALGIRRQRDRPLGRELRDLLSITHHDQRVRAALARPHVDVPDAIRAAVRAVELEHRPLIGRARIARPAHHEAPTDRHREELVAVGERRGERHQRGLPPGRGRALDAAQLRELLLPRNVAIDLGDLAEAQRDEARAWLVGERVHRGVVGAQHAPRRARGVDERGRDATGVVGAPLDEPLRVVEVDELRDRARGRELEGRRAGARERGIELHERGAEADEQTARGAGGRHRRRVDVVAEVLRPGAIDDHELRARHTDRAPTTCDEDGRLRARGLGRHADQLARVLGADRVHARLAVDPQGHVLLVGERHPERGAHRLAIEGRAGPRIDEHEATLRVHADRERDRFAARRQLDHALGLDGARDPRAPRQSRREGQPAQLASAALDLHDDLVAARRERGDALSAATAQDVDDRAVGAEPHDRVIRTQRDHTPRRDHHAYEGGIGWQ